MAEEHKRTHRRLEDWIGERVTVNLLRGPFAPADDAIVGVGGTLEGVDPMGGFLLYSPHDVAGKQGRATPPCRYTYLARVLPVAANRTNRTPRNRGCVAGLLLSTNCPEVGFSDVQRLAAERRSVTKVMSSSCSQPSPTKVLS